MSATVIKGKLKLKGSKGDNNSKSTSASASATSSHGGGSSKKRKSDDRHGDGDGDLSAVAADSAATSAPKHVDYLTEAEKRYRQRKLENDAKEARRMTAVTYRDRVESFNVKLSKMSEHNDIPRISAAGNG